MNQDPKKAMRLIFRHELEIQNLRRQLPDGVTKKDDRHFLIEPRTITKLHEVWNSPTYRYGRSSLFFAPDDDDRELIFGHLARTFAIYLAGSAERKTDAAKSDVEATAETAVETDESQCKMARADGWQLDELSIFKLIDPAPDSKTLDHPFVLTSHRDHDTEILEAMIGLYFERWTRPQSKSISPFDRDVQSFFQPVRAFQPYADDPPTPLKFVAKVMDTLLKSPSRYFTRNPYGPFDVSSDEERDRYLWPNMQNTIRGFSGPVWSIQDEHDNIIYPCMNPDHRPVVGNMVLFHIGPETGHPESIQSIITRPELKDLQSALRRFYEARFGRYRNDPLCRLGLVA